MFREIPRSKKETWIRVMELMIPNTSKTGYLVTIVITEDRKIRGFRQYLRYH